MQKKKELTPEERGASYSKSGLGIESNPFIHKSQAEAYQQFIRGFTTHKRRTGNFHGTVDPSEQVGVGKAPLTSNQASLVKKVVMINGTDVNTLTVFQLMDLLQHEAELYISHHVREATSFLIEEIRKRI